MLEALLKELVRRLQPHIEKLKLWHLIGLIIFAMLGSMVYLVPGGIPAAAKNYLRSIQYTPRAFARSETVPLSQHQADKIKTHIRRLSLQLQGVYDTRQRNNFMNAWGIAQVVLALNDSAILSSNDLKQAIVATQTRDHFWSEFINAPLHIPSTTWSLLALRSTDFDSAVTLENLIGIQRSDGAWSIYNVPDVPENASTYATAWAALALNSWIDRPQISEDLTNRLKKSLRRAVTWLVDNHSKDQIWLWPDYPKNTPESSPSISLSGLVIHVLHIVKEGQDLFDFPAIANEHLDNLPPYNYTPWSKEMSGTVLFGGKDKEGYKDSVRYYILPWLVIAAVDTYQHGGFRQRVAALTLIDNLVANLDQFAREMEAEKRPWIAAEYLISLRYLLGEKAL